MRKSTKNVKMWLWKNIQIAKHQSIFTTDPDKTLTRYTRFNEIQCPFIPAGKRNHLVTIVNADGNIQKKIFCVIPPEARWGIRNEKNALPSTETCSSLHFYRWNPVNAVLHVNDADRGLSLHTADTLKQSLGWNNCMAYCKEMVKHEAACNSILYLQIIIFVVPPTKTVNFNGTYVRSIDRCALE